MRDYYNELGSLAECPNITLKDLWSLDWDDLPELVDTSNVIYCVENQITHLKYVGQSVYFWSRWKPKYGSFTHFTGYKNQIGHSQGSLLYLDFIKYGLENFRVYLLVEDSKDLNADEIRYIKELNTLIKDGLGYNLSDGYEGNLHTPETRDKILFSTRLTKGFNLLYKYISELEDQNLEINSYNYVTYTSSTSLQNHLEGIISELDNFKVDLRWRDDMHFLEDFTITNVENDIENVRIIGQCLNGLDYLKESNINITLKSLCMATGNAIRKNLEFLVNYHDILRKYSQWNKELETIFSDIDYKNSVQISLDDIVNPGFIQYDKERLCYRDQLNRVKEIWISKNQMSSYIEETYDLTLEEYYNLIVNANRNKILKCPYCGNPIEFRSLLRPYANCCEKCRNDNKLKLIRDEYLAEISVPLTISNDEFEEVKDIRIKYLKKILKETGEETDSLIKLVKRRKIVYMSQIADLVNRGLLNERYLTKSKIRDFLKHRGFLDEEITDMICEDRTTGKLNINFSKHD